VHDVSDDQSNCNCCKFLNLDLDFFLNAIAHDRKSRTRRVSERHYKPWPEEAVREFLERQCGLTRQSPVSGRFSVHHDAVFDYWHCLIKTMPPRTQIDLTHVDAHGDFMAAFRNFSQYDKGISFIKKLLLHKDPAQRTYEVDRNRYYVTLANYMSFAVACRWIKRIEFVTHPKWQNDLGRFFKPQEPPDHGLIEIRSSNSTVTEAVPITLTARARFSSGEFTNAFLCQSPNYTPRTADKLIPVFEEYIDFTAA
jgi:UPF0489 domain